MHYAFSNSHANTTIYLNITSEEKKIQLYRNVFASRDVQIRKNPK